MRLEHDFGFVLKKQIKTLKTFTHWLNHPLPHNVFCFSVSNVKSKKDKKSGDDSESDVDNSDMDDLDDEEVSLGSMDEEDFGDELEEEGGMFMDPDGDEEGDDDDDDDEGKKIWQSTKTYFNPALFRVPVQYSLFLN